LAIDGCLINLPWIEELKEEFGGKTGKAGEVEAISAQSSGLYNCLNHIMILIFSLKKIIKGEKKI
jgi:hypothetical protein